MVGLLTDAFIWSSIFKFREPEVAKRFLKEVLHRDGPGRSLLLKG